MDIAYGVLSVFILMTFIIFIVIVRDVNLKMVKEKTDDPIKNKRRVRRYYGVLVLMVFVDIFGTAFIGERFAPTTNLYLSMTDMQGNFCIFILVITIGIILFYGQRTYQKRLSGCLDTKGIQIDHSDRAGFWVFGPYAIAIGIIGQSIIEHLVLLFMISVFAGLAGIFVILGVIEIGLWVLKKPLEFWFRKKSDFDSAQ